MDRGRYTTVNLYWLIAFDHLQHFLVASQTPKRETLFAAVLMRVLPHAPLREVIPLPVSFLLSFVDRDASTGRIISRSSSLLGFPTRWTDFVQEMNA